MKQKILVLELWGLGDLTFSTPLLQRALEAGHEVHLAGKDYAPQLLEATFPSVKFFAFDAPWSRYRGKYQFWRWDWWNIVSMILQLRRERYDIAMSVRNDPRDHFFMWLIGARRRFGFPVSGGKLFLTDPVIRSRSLQHKVEDWRDIGTALGLPKIADAFPELTHSAYRSPRVDALFAKLRKPTLCLHPGARIAARRWPSEYFEKIIKAMRAEFDFHLLLVPDPDGYGENLAPLADQIAAGLTIPELVDALGRSDLLLCNDSGPAHMAASCGRPAIILFGPSEPEWFRPWGADHKVIIRDICPWRPCFDYCHFSEPFCMTKLLPESAWPEIRSQIAHLVERRVLPSVFLKSPPSPASP